MPKIFITLLLITQINYLYLSPTNSFKKKNLKEVPKINKKLIIKKI